jgi:hypothetical protein
LNRATDTAKKEYLKSVYYGAMEFQRTRCYGLIYTKTRGIGQKEKPEIYIDQRKVLKILENYIIKLYGQATLPEHIEFISEEEETADEKGPYICAAK